MSERASKQNKQGAMVHPDFARRLSAAANSNPLIPAMNSGRLTYIAEQLQKHGEKVTVETVRERFSCETRPYHSRINTLAAVLQVDPMALLSDVGLSGESTSPSHSETVKRSAIQQLISAIFGIENMHIAYPKPDDETAA